MTSAYKVKQADLFRQHLEVAAELGLNCVIHQRDALEDTLALLQPFADRVRGVFHCFANDAATMRRIVALGSLVSFTGILTFKNGQNIRDALAATPLDQFMLETDCPFLAPMPYRGKRCEPAYVKEISEVAAQVKGCSLEESERRHLRDRGTVLRQAPSALTPLLPLRYHCPCDGRFPSGSQADLRRRMAGEVGLPREVGVPAGFVLARTQPDQYPQG